MKPARIMLLLVAIIAGGLAAFLATRGGGRPAPAHQVVAEVKAPTNQILIAKSNIGVGERLSSALVQWQPWPSAAMRADYIAKRKDPEAAAKISGAVARFQFFAGEPILEAKLARTDQGYLSAVLAPGMRGVSIPVSAATGSGGFIVPNDRVDVVVTNASQGTTTSRTLLHDVKVLAIGDNLGQTDASGKADAKAQAFKNSTIATLELDPVEADQLINATALGKVALVLRSVADFGKGQTASAGGQNGPVSIIRFGKQTDVNLSALGADQGAGADATPTLAPAVYVPDAASAPPSTPVAAHISAPTPPADAPAPPPIPQFQ